MTDIPTTMQETKEVTATEPKVRATGMAQAENSAPQPVEEVMYCANHPDVETLLRCNRCGKPICLKCAQLTDVGYRCNECIRAVQDTYFNAKPSDNIVAFVVAFLVTAVAAPIASILFRIFPFWFISIIIAVMVGGAAGGVLTQIVRRAVDKRRSREMKAVALAGIVAGTVVGIGATAAVLGIPMSALLSLPLLVFAFLAAMSTYQLLR
jgi:hypothetical protein